MLDLDAYLARIGERGRPDLDQVHRAHVTSIPFENLDPRRGIPVSLEPDDLERKLVTNRRGGYCFEQNLLLKAALEALGADVEMLPRPRSRRAPPGHARARGLTSSSESRPTGRDGTPTWASVTAPCSSRSRSARAASHEQAGWRFRVVEDGRELVLQSVEDGEWVDLYGFVPEPVPLIDVETSNWFTSTSSALAVRHRPDRQRPATGWHPRVVERLEGDLSLTEETPTTATVTDVEPDAVGELVATRFGLDGFDV